MTYVAEPSPLHTANLMDQRDFCSLTYMHTPSAVHLEPWQPKEELFLKKIYFIEV